MRRSATHRCHHPMVTKINETQMQDAYSKMGKVKLDQTSVRYTGKQSVQAKEPNR